MRVQPDRNRLEEISWRLDKIRGADVEEAIEFAPAALGPHLMHEQNAEAPRLVRRRAHDDAQLCVEPHARILHERVHVQVEQHVTELLESAIESRLRALAV